MSSKTLIEGQHTYRGPQHRSIDQLQPAAPVSNIDSVNILTGVNRINSRGRRLYREAKARLKGAA